MLQFRYFVEADEVCLRRTTYFLVFILKLPTLDFSYCPYPLTCQAWLALPKVYAPASIALRVIEGCKSPLHDKELVLEENGYYYYLYYH
jgi:hypothetical protein